MQRRVYESLAQVKRLSCKPAAMNLLHGPLSAIATESNDLSSTAITSTFVEAKSNQWLNQ